MSHVSFPNLQSAGASLGYLNLVRFGFCIFRALAVLGMLLLVGHYSRDIAWAWDGKKSCPRTEVLQPLAQLLGLRCQDETLYEVRSADWPSGISFPLFSDFLYP